MQLSSDRTTDVGPFYFKIEIPQHKSFTFSQNTMTIDVLRTPEPPTMSVEVLGKVVASCTVFHSCPTSPPRFYWSHSGIKKTRSKRLNKWMWTTVSILTFVLLSSDFDQSLNCTVMYRGKKTAHLIQL
ncbi:hypothetical protein CHARACLAT_028429 [Characodon lateralis]|uniref:Ig-like domain-containing protein n=1 Tax=Characodon lateralis TaxID=208331 RepID=A0ABU7F9W5_9TELE|nr:hypothetical protein [Characodon lateralis]